LLLFFAIRKTSSPLLGVTDISVITICSLSGAVD